MILSTIVSWWRGANSSNILGTLLFLAVSMVFFQLNQRAEEGYKQAENVASALRTNDQHNVTAMREKVKDTFKLDDFNRKLDDYEDKEHLDQPLPADIRQWLQSVNSH